MELQDWKAAFAHTRRARTRARHPDTHIGILYKDTRTRTYAGECTASSVCVASHTRPHADILTRSQVPGPIPFTHKLRYVHRCPYIPRQAQTCVHPEKSKVAHLLHARQPAHGLK